MNVEDKIVDGYRAVGNSYTVISQAFGNEGCARLLFYELAEKKGGSEDICRLFR